MAFRVIEILIEKACLEDVHQKLDQNDIIDSWTLEASKDNHVIINVLLHQKNAQNLLDDLKPKIDKKEIKKIIVSAPETVLFDKKEKEKQEKLTNDASTEELYDKVSENAKLDLNFLLLTLLSTIVASLGLIDNLVIAIIGAMLIAPLLEPNIAMALAVVLGDLKLFFRSLITSSTAIILTLSISFLIGWFYPLTAVSEEIVQRTSVDLMNIMLALASGSAAALSLITRLSTVLVGVMVAVALLPPLSAAGILFSMHQYNLALGAITLFTVNLVCINLSANIVFILKGLRPSQWHERRRAKIAIIWYTLFWIIALVCLAFMIISRHKYK